MKFTTAFEPIYNNFGTEQGNYRDAEMLMRICSLIDACGLTRLSKSLSIKTNFEDVSIDSDDPIFSLNEIGNHRPSSIESVNPLHFFEHRKEAGQTYWTGGEPCIIPAADLIVYISKIEVGFDSNIGQLGQKAKVAVKNNSAITALIDLMQHRMLPLLNEVYGEKEIIDTDFYRMDEFGQGLGNWTYWAPSSLKVDRTGYDHSGFAPADGLVIQYIAYEKVLLGATEQAPWGKLYQYRTYSNGSGDRWYYKPLA